MLKALFKKQLMEVNSWLIQNKKSGKHRSRGGMLLYALLYAVIFAGLGAVFYFVGASLCAPLVSAGLGWLYFAMMSLMALLLGVFGSVFSTYATLYQAKDNTFLLSMPIPPRAILEVRLFAVWMWGLIYEAIVFIPALVVYWQNAAELGCLSAAAVVLDLLLLLVLSVLVLTLTCALGWVVARISSRLKNKSVAAVLASLLFLAGYYYVYFRASAILQHVLQNAGAIGESIRGAAVPIYWMGRAGEGDLLSMLFFGLLVLALFALACRILSRSFLKMATTNRGAAKRTYRESAARQRSAAGALLFKERSRFFASATYMLNCGLGTLMLVVLGILALVKGPWLRDLMAEMGFSGAPLALMACAVLCVMTAMNDISAPSVSLEGKNLWLVQVLPVSAWQVLQAKLKLHLLMTEVPTLFCAVCMAIALRPGVFFSIMLAEVPMLFVLFSACFGLTVNLKTPNLKWSDETVPVKQSMGVMLSMFGGWALVAAMCMLYLLLNKYLSPELYLLCVAAAVAAACAGLLLWLKNRGARIFREL